MMTWIDHIAIDAPDLNRQPTEVGRSSPFNLERAVRGWWDR